MTRTSTLSTFAWLAAGISGTLGRDVSSWDLPGAQAAKRDVAITANINKVNLICLSFPFSFYLTNGFV
jgi:hypothetical protein